MSRNINQEKIKFRLKKTAVANEETDGICDFHLSSKFLMKDINSHAGQSASCLSLESEDCVSSHGDKRVMCVPGAYANECLSLREILRR